MTRFYDNQINYKQRWWLLPSTTAYVITNCDSGHYKVRQANSLQSAMTVYYEVRQAILVSK